MAPIIKIAIIQFMPKPLDLGHNFGLSTNYIRQAASLGAQIAVLPEYHLTSWCPDEKGFIEGCRESMGYLDKYRELASSLGINIVPGTICEVHPSGESGGDTKDVEIRNMTYFISGDGDGGIGEIVGRYQKKNLWHPERPHLTAGDVSSKHEGFEVEESLPKWEEDGKSIRVGLLICWDIIFPECFRELIMSESGVDIIIIPAFWLLNEDFGEVEEGRIKRAQEKERKMLEGLVWTRAYENCCTVCFVNACGGSMVAGAGVFESEPMGVGQEEEGCKIVEVDLEEDRRLEGRYKIREDLRKMRRGK
ncbi:carbon-nitrogen hydrolase [Podospora fimiseda]|uniref:Carbon-nitrogen hydrolase n=1 Tax=Podospora fimiseda TaxID=252190 RepID=A0AAN7C155_9PEZI|nr:carbon-nitrogen hydrolase [Podospora fimiseda]